MKQPKPLLHLHYVDEYVVEEGIQRFTFPDGRKRTFVCEIAAPHFVETEIIFLTDKNDRSFIFCPKHHDFVDVSENPSKLPEK